MCPAVLAGKLKELFDSECVKNAGTDLKMTVIKGVDLTSFDAGYWEKVEIGTTFFLGCVFGKRETEILLQRKGAVLFPPLEGLPYNPYRCSLYSPKELQDLTSGVSLDRRIYCDYVAKGKFYPDVIEALCRRIHDDSIDDALQRLINEIGPLKMIGVMGGSSMNRRDLGYRKTAQTTRLLTLSGHFVISGGGPGMMEAANLGAYFSKFGESDLDEALKILALAPECSNPMWMRQSLEVKRRFPNGADSLGIPTWFYGSEPTNAFANKVAKYFDNSIREGGLLQIAKAGVIFAPGSAGTRQEIFMDAAQNHYGTTGFYSPMVFLGRTQYQREAPIYPLLRKVANKDYSNFLFITDSPIKVQKFIETHPPQAKKMEPDPICHG
jgi:predicted Rossmann-fold nucleotide-binding protein